MINMVTHMLLLRSYMSNISSFQFGIYSFLKAQTFTDYIHTPPDNGIENNCHGQAFTCCFGVTDFDASKGSIEQLQTWACCKRDTKEKRNLIVFLYVVKIIDLAHIGLSKNL
ncbi:hypothetical protein ACJX0J_007916 [Zea mays]